MGRLEWDICPIVKEAGVLGKRGAGTGGEPPPFYTTGLSRAIMRVRLSAAVTVCGNSRVGFFRLANMEEELSRLLGGRKVDLRTPNDLSVYFRDEVASNAMVAYAAS